MRLAVLLLVLALASAGCSDKPRDGFKGETSGTSSTSPPATPPATNTTVAASKPSLVLSGCTNFGGVFPVPVADAQAALPPGFTPVQAANDPAMGATMYILTLRCEGSSVDGNDTGPTFVTYAELTTVPPDAFKLEGITDYTVPLAIGASVDAVDARLKEFGLAHAGATTTSDIQDNRPGPYSGRMVVDGITLQVTTQTSSQNGAALASGDFALIGAQDGVVHSIVRGHSEGGSATQATATQQSTGLPIFANARPVALGFSVTGFTLTFELAATFA